jgi:magnesium chelatase accessory protein
MKAAPEWDVEGRDWPNRSASRFVDVGELRWHVQIMGQGPVMLLLHGTGASTHSWRALASRLSERFKVFSFDLPGHGFTQLPANGQFGLPKMAGAVGQLLAELQIAPDIAVGHSAGAAIAIRMALDRQITPRLIVSLNGALLPFPGMAAIAFPALAKLLFLNPFAAPFFAWRASDSAAVRRLIAGTGSTLDAEGIELYTRLFRTERHVAGAVGMMAKWDLQDLKRDLPGLAPPLVLVSAERDRAVPPGDALKVKALLPTATIVPVENCGHLAHEEEPLLFANLISGLAP